MSGGTIEAFRTTGEGEMYTFARPCEHALLTSCSRRVPSDFGIFLDTTDGTTTTVVVGVRLNGTTTIVRGRFDIPSLGVTVDFPESSQESPNVTITITIMPNSPLQDDCGLCGKRDGTLVLPNGNAIDPNSDSDIQELISSYKVMPGDTFLMDHRRECGM